MEFKQYGDRFVLRLEKGEEILAALKEFCTAQQIRAGMVRGIGAVSQATISYYDPEQRKYLDRELTGDREITSLLGNISLTEGAVMLHLHVNLADQAYGVLGGHLSSGVIGATGELVIDDFLGSMERRPVDENGLRLLKLD